MRWTFVFCILISSAFIASSNPDESRRKRSLSFLTSLFFNDMRRIHGKCTNPSQCKSSRGKQTSAFSDRQKNAGLSASENKRKQTRTPKGARNNGGSSLTNIANDPYQAESRALGTRNTIARTASQNSNRESPQNIPNLSDTKLTGSGESRATNLAKNLNIHQNIYETPVIYTYEQPNIGTMQTFAIENNPGFLLPENVNQLPMPGYVDNGLGDIIWSVPPYPHQPLPGFASEQYEDPIMSPYLLLDHQQGSFGMNTLPNNYMSMYTGAPIVVMEDTSEKNVQSKSFKDSEINEDKDRKCKQKPRGDISETNNRIDRKRKQKPRGDGEEIC